MRSLVTHISGDLCGNIRQYRWLHNHSSHLGTKAGIGNTGKDDEMCALRL